MVEAAVTFSLIFLGLSAWAAAVLARNFYRGRPVRRLGDGDPSFIATLFSDGARSDDGQMPRHRHQVGQHHGSDVPTASRHGGDFGSGHHGGGFGTGGHH